MTIEMPFMEARPGAAVYASEAWPGLKLKYGERHLMLEAPQEMDGLSSAVYGGGFGKLRRMVNIYVDRQYRCDDPARDIADLLGQWGYPSEATAGLLTAVPMRYAAVAEERGEDFAVFCCATAGASTGSVFLPHYRLCLYPSRCL
ncbi:adenosylcobinamide amidohydrolase [Paenibacillus rubinfantis]|uniref:adenosylcobinamide amidohydrolase n=1 Tax=Paenibacillus rubinfantis TaxID=1720296 RepID=UPI001E50FED2|nr:adenosylcobinamide amidohydrolase [Paenibacillus rubinfantis]